MNDKLRDDLAERAERILPSYQISLCGLPAAEQMVRESDAHACLATEHYREALTEEELGRPSLRSLLHAVVHQQAAAFAQGRAALMLLAETVEEEVPLS